MPSINELNLKKCCILLKALNNPIRIKILELLQEHGSLTVTEIMYKIKIDQSPTSQHLHKMRIAGFVKTTKDGKHVHYSVDEANLNRILQGIDYIIQ